MRFIAFLWGLLLACLILGVVRTCRAADNEPKYREVQRVSVDWRTRSITFLSAGYTADQENQFQSDVNKCVDALYGRVRGVASEPWNRYASLLNIYAVFQPSVDANTTVGKKEALKNDQIDLECSISHSYPLFISCNLSAVFALSTYAPTKDLIVVLVNDPSNVVGEGGKSLAVFTNAPLFMPFLAVRELSKAIASLSSEYAMGVEEKYDVYVPNCAPSIEAARARWDYWIDQGLVDKTPSRGCFFTNYYRPSESDCMMRKSSKEGLCAVCKEQVNIALLSADPNFSRPTTRCTRTAQKVQLDKSKDIQLNIGEITGMTNMSVSWMLGNGTIFHAAHSSQLVVPKELWNNWSLPTELCAVITDNSPYIRPVKGTKLFRRILSYELFLDKSAPFEMKMCGMSDSCTPCEGSGCDDSHIFFSQDFEGKKQGAAKAKTTNYVISVAVCTSFALLVLLIVTVLYLCCYLKRPHELFSTLFMDLLIRKFIFIISFNLVGLSIFSLASVLLFLDVHAMLSKHLLIPYLGITVWAYSTALLNIASVIFRWYAFVIACSAFFLVNGLLHTIIGALWVIVTVFEGDCLLGYVSSRWLKTAITRPSEIELIQSVLQCSGFFVSCLEVTSSSCPKESVSNMYAKPCEKVFMRDLYASHGPITASVFITGLLLVASGLLNVVFLIRSFYLSKIGIQRRKYHSDPEAAVLPLTFEEARKLRRMFYRVSDKTNRTLAGRAVTQFLEKVFRTKLEPGEKRKIENEGPVTFDKLMSLFFPHFITSRMDPRQLTPEETQEVRGVFELQTCQYQKFCRFATASGALSPETLFKLFCLYTSDHFTVDESEFISLIKAEAETNCPDASMCRGLTVFELEGLRHVWAALNPKILGDLNDEQIALFYQWTHDEPLYGDSHFQEWKESLDVRQRGSIGWGEFCYPFAQRALLWKARRFLSDMEKEVPPEMIKKNLVEQRFGCEVVNAVFLPYEDEVPIERVLEYVLFSSKSK
ncbi:hypothetical protein MOQ_002576 [Trypanosoma cruzi marinkellei]|uniref:IgA Peptidase M64 n=1 Tax=Trypanosoma cruzi marinkellei TaxID=85056 RepID=K2NF71_TRYCR|nr:hypothetical protein MOQ_002576 [Trypanosoma cruzi marinkellei]